MSKNLKDSLLEVDDKYGGQMHKLFGPALMGYPLDSDSSRGYMFTSSLKQVLNLLNPDVPRVQTSYENVFGKYNKAYRKLDGVWTVEAKIDKFGDGLIYILVLYNRLTDTYDMIEKIVAESLTERFGFIYNNDRLDTLEIGEVIDNEIIYKSTSYDEHMNYRYGKNAKVYYSTSSDTLEDAIVIRRSWADNVISSEVDPVEVMINDNDVLLNMQGTDSDYKPVPNIGETVKNSTLCAIRRINKNHLLYDFQSQNMKEPTSTDIEYSVTKNSILYDVNIYYNKEEPFPDNIFYKQLKFYYECGCQYADNIYNWATKIKDSGSKYTDNVTYLRSKYKNFNNPEYKWKNKDKEFSNMLVEFKVKANVSLEPGSKLTGRFGDKGVVSRIAEDVRDGAFDNMLGMMGKEINDEEREKLSKKITIMDDDKMPYTDRFPVDILMNLSGCIRRLNTGQLYEVELNFIGEEIRHAITQMDNDEDKLIMAFDFLKMVNEDQYEFFYGYYKSIDKSQVLKGRTINFIDGSAKKAFIKDIEENGFYLIKKPEADIRYTTIKKIYEKFSFIKPLPLYIDIFGTKKRRIIKDGIVGDKYILVLKHNSNKSFSARSTFRVNRANLPTKDITKKTNRSPHAKSPIRLSEIYNLMSSISGADLAEFNIHMRSSTLGRKALDQILATPGNPLEIKRLEIKDNFINANADILGSKLKAIGLRLNFSTGQEIDPDGDVLIDVVMPLYIDKFTIYDTPLNKMMYVELFKEYRKYLSKYTIIETYQGEKVDLAWEHVFGLEEMGKYDISEETKDMLILTTKGLDLRDSSMEERQKESQEELPLTKKTLKAKL